MNATRHYDSDDLALYAMQLFSKEEAAEIAAHLAACATCRHQVAEHQGDLAIYAMTAEMHSQPAQARERLMKQVAREKKAVPVERPPVPVPFENTLRGQNSFSRGLGSGRYLDEEEVTPRRNIAAKVFPWVGWAVAAGLAVTAGSLYHERQALRASATLQAAQIDRLSSDAAAAKQLVDTMTDPTARQVTLTKAPATQTPPQPQGRVTYVPRNGTLIFLASNMEPLQTYKTYELWLIPADGRDPIPAGTFHPDDRGNASVILPPLPKGIEARAFGITVEDDGGSQTPTMPIVMAGN
ncbi:anti-sigma factor [Edaphobacter bradus]|uniref:anti-sigma factor n=1 Tax=Edaphobacter bradus TaxID=2259016 RepID=UPI0021E03972|nr:anti-sigma factor [Edaphobacter bradus]